MLSADFAARPQGFVRSSDRHKAEITNRAGKATEINATYLRLGLTTALLDVPVLAALRPRRNGGAAGRDGPSPGGRADPGRTLGPEAAPVFRENPRQPAVTARTARSGPRSPQAAGGLFPGRCRRGWAPAAAAAAAAGEPARASARPGVPRPPRSPPRRRTAVPTPQAGGGTGAAARSFPPR